MTLSFTTTLWLGDFETVDHSALGVARLIWQYRSLQPRLQGALAAFLDDIQSIEDVTLEVLAGIWPLTAVGDQLDVIGAIVGQPRGELTDAEYRIMVLGRIFVNRSNGTIPEILELLEILGVDSDVLVVEGAPAEIVVSVAGTTYGSLIGELVGDLKAGGVTLRWIWSDEDEDDTLTFASALGVEQEADSTRGFGDLADGGTTGGHFSGSYIR